MNVTERTLEWYSDCFKALNNPNPTDSELKVFVIGMREKGWQATTCNNHIRAINAYLHWKTVGMDVKCSPSCKHQKLSYLKEEDKVLPTFSIDDIKKFVQWKPKTWTETRLQLLVLFLADVGSRIIEALSVKWPDTDLENLLVTLHGKGKKDRKVPFSYELRKYLFKFKMINKYDLVFCTKDGMKLDRCIMLRDVKLLCERLRIDAPERTLHAFRHTFALNYLRKGGSVFHLQKSLVTLI